MKKKYAKIPNFSFEFGILHDGMGMVFNYVTFIPTLLSKRGDDERIF